ncbi:E3 ubiquitin-protein ligase rnf213-alpha-like [Polymixia lowei]
MKCSSCHHVIAEKTAKYCSQCGHLLSTQTVNKSLDTESLPISSSLEPVLEGVTESQNSSTSVENHESNISSKRLSDETNNNPKKKRVRVRRKKTKKKKDGSMSSEQEQMPSDLSHTSSEDKHVKKMQEGRDSSDSDSSDNTVDEKLDSLCDGFSSLESQPSSVVPPSTTKSFEGTPVSHNKTGTATPEPNTEPRSAVTSGNQITRESGISVSTVTQSSEPAQADTPTSSSKSEGDKNATPQSAKDKEVTNARDQKTEGKTSKSKKDMTNTKKTKPDQSANMDENANQTEQTKQKVKNDPQGQQLRQMPANEKVFGSSNTSKIESKGSSVDPQVKVGSLEEGDASSVKQTPDSKGNKDDSNDKTETKDDPPPKRITRRNKQVAASDRLTVYFHAVLSKDFKFDRDEDRVFLRAGKNIGDWTENIVELFVSKDLGEHGFLIEGSLTTTKSDALTVSIPYKYVVYKKKKGKYEYEHIYKLDSQNITNRCLFVKSQLLSEEGDWHQYDDIICAEPTKNMLKRFKESVKEVIWPEQRNKVVQGKEIAGKVMLETIFDLLRSWTDINLKNFLIQLNQFFEIYGNPSVYEETHKKWYSLNYGEKEVKAMVKEYMVENVIPQLLKDGDGQSLFIQDPMRAAVIMLYVWRRHGVKLLTHELNQLCTVLCLPKLAKDEFLKYWADFSHAVTSLKNLPAMLVDLMNSVKTDGMHRWILVIPLLHLIKGTTKPFQEVPASITSKYDLPWAGLQGLKGITPASLYSQERR